MIENRTVFILGAGAHCSYGFPSGEVLKSDIIVAVERSIRANDNLSFDQSFVHIAHRDASKVEEVRLERCRAFVEALRNAGQPSIDAFLNANRHQLGFETIGKGAIAQVLLEYESREPKKDDDWLDYLFKIMIDGTSSPKEFVEKNAVSFVTFNYDRLLERWLLNRIKHSFGLQEANAFEIFKKIPIHHIYGSLGQFPDPDVHDRRAWISASRGIKTIFDAEHHDSKTIETSKQLIASARVICMLGFGFHRENIELLNLPWYLKQPRDVVASTRFDITQAEWARVMKVFDGGHKILSTNQDDRCLATIRNLPIF